MTQYYKQPYDIKLRTGKLAFVWSLYEKNDFKSILSEFFLFPLNSYSFTKLYKVRVYESFKKVCIYFVSEDYTI